MLEQTVTPVASESVPSAGMETAPVSQEPTESVTPPVTDMPTVQPEETFTKFDIKTLSKEGLIAYKKLQADYTRQRQQDTQKLKQWEEQIKMFQPLLSDRDVQAKIYLHQYGKYPDGYQPVKPEPVTPSQEPINYDAIQDPDLKAILQKQGQLLDQYQLAEQRRQKQEYSNMEKMTTESVKSFYDKLSVERKQIWDSNLNEIKQLAIILANGGESVDKSLVKAFNSVGADKLYELGKLEAFKTMQSKILKPKPEVGVGAGATGLDRTTKAKTAEEAVAMAMDEVDKKYANQ
jgi:hypothetical protein